MRIHLVSLATVAALLTLAGCSEPAEETNEVPDAGATVDAGLGQDAGAASDAGSLADASVADAGHDAGVPDAGAAVDAGGVDAGPCATWPDYEYAEPDCGPEPLRVQFDGDQAIADTGLDIYALTWSFGDGETSFATNPVHAYQQAGDYEASVALTADVGGTDFTVNRTGIRIRVSR